MENKDKIVKTSEISIKVHLDEKYIPAKMDWDATDSSGGGRKDTKATMVAIWDHQAKEALRIDLWTKDMPVNEMNHFFYQTLITMSDSYRRATGNQEMSEEMKAFAKQFGQKLDLFKKPS